MTNKNRRNWTPRAMILVSTALAIGLVDLQPSFAKICGEYCEAKLVRAKCEDLVRKNELKGHRRVAEFEKCKARLMNYENSKEKMEDVRSSSGF
jgi:hypothetical protein